LPAAIQHLSDRRPFVGRDEERDLLLQALDGAAVGRFGAVFVAGMPGIGKTALSVWFGREAHRRGAAVVLGRADEGAGVPFQPISEALGHWVAHAGDDDLRALREADAARLARLVPELRERLGGLPAAPVIGPEVDRERLFAALVRWVEVVGANGPAVLVMDDLHWADLASVHALRHLLRHPPAAGAVLLVTHRATQIDGGEPTAELLSAVRGDPTVRSLTLGGLRDSDVVDLVGHATGGDPSEADRAFAARLNRRTGGNPFFIHELLRPLSEAGTAPDDALVAGVPAGVTGLIERRLVRLPGPTVPVLRVAAVLGLEIELTVLSRAAEETEIALVEALEPGIDAGLVVAGEPAAGRLAFAHSLVREAIVAGLPAAERERLHWRAGEAISAVHPGRHLRLGDVARHLAAGVRAGDAAVAVNANVRAGYHALSSLALEDARSRFATATDLLASTAVGDPLLAYEAWLGMAQASAALGDLAGHWDGGVGAATVARRQGWRDMLVWAAMVLVTHGLAAGGRDPAGRPGWSELIDEALADVAERPTRDGCLLLALNAILAVVCDRADDAQALADRADVVARSLDESDALAGALLARSWVLSGGPRPRELAEVADRALSLTVAPATEVMTRSLMAGVSTTAALQMGDRAEAEAIRARLAGPETPHTTQTRAWLRIVDTGTALFEGRFAAAEAGIRAARAASNGTSERGGIWDALCRYQELVLAAERGCPDGMAAVLAASAGDLLPGSTVDAWSALASARAGDRGAATRRVAALRHRRALDRLGSSAPVALRHLAEVAAIAGDRSLAAELLPVLRAYEGQLFVSFAAASVEAAADRSLGQVLLVLGRHDEAVERLANAEAAERLLGADALAPRSAYWHARARLARRAEGDTERARSIVQAVREDAGRLGMVQLGRDAGALLQA
jgi:hypothetical protein